MGYRVFRAAGPGNVIQAHKHWIAGEHDPTEVSITFSSQFEEFCRDIGASAYIVSQNANRDKYRDGPFTIEHRPKPRSAGGLKFHITEIAYGLSLSQLQSTSLSIAP